MEQQQEPDSWLSRTSRSISRLLSRSRSCSQSQPKQHSGHSRTAAAVRAANRGPIPAASAAVSPVVTDTSCCGATTFEWASTATPGKCSLDVDGDVIARTPSDLNSGSFTKKQQQHTQQQSSQASSRHQAATPAGRSSSQLELRHPSSSANTREGQQRRSSHEGRVHRSKKKEPVGSESQQQQQVVTGQSLRDKWQSMWDISKEAQTLAKAAAAAATAAAEQQALLAAAEEEEEEEEQPPTGASTAAARRSSYNEAGGELLQLQQQPLDPWVRDLAAWAQQCPELIRLQLLDNIPVPEAYQLPNSYWQDRHPPTATVPPAAQPEDAAAGTCRKSTQQEQSGKTSSSAATDAGKSLQEQQQQQQQEKEKDLKPLEKPVDFVAELAQAVAAVKGLVEASADVASCGLSAHIDATHAVLEEGWRVVQEVDWELDAYENYTKWVPKRAQHVSLQAVLQQLEVLQCEA